MSALAPGHAAAAHIPVLYAQVLEGLAVQPAGTYLDGTFGRGGHARGVLQRLGPDGRLLVIDKDPAAIEEARQAFANDARVAIHHGSFAALDKWDETASGLDGVLFDLGVSSPQLDEAGRGFSFGKDGPLDMRMDPTRGESAADWLAREDETTIADVIWRYGEERRSRRIARAIAERRALQPLMRTAELAALVAQAVPRGRDASHPATRTFQAIRIHINNELGDVEHGLAAAHAHLNRGGRLAVISFHSLEDRLVKQFMARHAKAPPGNRRAPVEAEFQPTLRLVGGAQKAGEAELRANPRARSAVLRVAERLAQAA